jgi:hypothetical protein
MDNTHIKGDYNQFYIVQFQCDRNMNKGSALSEIQYLNLITQHNCSEAKNFFRNELKYQF